MGVLIIFYLIFSFLHAAVKEFPIPVAAVLLLSFILFTALVGGGEFLSRSRKSLVVHATTSVFVP
ncbi:MAG: hypothetical protein LBP35_04905 [Candidatus Ancillula trichonymphae]|nr:hypothetical protein [Candidatus Ancillula trichonymphae]